MPKEFIDNASWSAEDSPTWQETRIKVTWGRDAQYVQLATVADAEDATEWSDGWHIDMNRRTINELIRVLRRARDQAYGRDE